MQSLSGVAPQTLRRYELDQPIRDASRRRIEAALQTLGIIEPAAPMAPAIHDEAPRG